MNKEVAFATHNRVFQAGSKNINFNSEQMAQTNVSMDSLLKSRKLQEITCPCEVQGYRAQVRGVNLHFKPVVAAIRLENLNDP